MMKEVARFWLQDVGVDGFRLDAAKHLIEDGDISGEYVLAPLLDTDQFPPPAITEQGGFENYKPVPEIPPYGRFIMQLQSVYHKVTEGSPKTGVRANARTPVFGYSFNFRDLPTITDELRHRATDD